MQNNKKKYELELKIPSWRPDITQAIDIVEEIVRIKGYNNIETLEPEKTRIKPTLNKELGKKSPDSNSLDNTKLNSLSNPHSRRLTKEVS